MSFRLVSNSVTLNDLQRHNSPQVRVISQNSVFWTHYVKVVEDTPILSAVKCSPKNIVFNMAILAGDLPSESIKVRHSPLASENLSNNQP